MSKRKLPLSSGDRNRKIRTKPGTRPVAPPELPFKAANMNTRLYQVVDQLEEELWSKSDTSASSTSASARYSQEPYPSLSGAHSREYARRIRKRTLLLF